MERFDFFHKKALVVLWLISIFIGFIILVTLFKEKYYLDNLEKRVLEVVWTGIPGLILFLLAVPSLRTLYYLDLPSCVEPEYTFKAVGHQWYWDYSRVINGSEKVYRSYLRKEPDFERFRNLEASLPLVVPGNRMVRGIVSSEDVIHRFALPQLGVKIDGVPGRYNQIFFMVKGWGKFYGQCSEICGANHSFMPIRVESVKIS